MMCKRPACGKVFEPTKPWQVFCHRKCRDMHHNAAKKSSVNPLFSGDGSHGPSLPKN